MLLKLGFFQPQFALGLGLSTHLLLVLLFIHLLIFVNLLEDIFQCPVVLGIDQGENWLVLVVWLRHCFHRLKGLAVQDKG